MNLITFQPHVELEYFSGYIALKFEKGTATAVNIYRRYEDGDWTFIGSATSSPFIDTQPVRVSGIPEDRDYKVIAVKDKKEIWPESPVAGILVGG